MESKEEKISWIYNKLSSLLSFPVPADLIDNPEHAKFVNDLQAMMSEPGAGSLNFPKLSTQKREMSATEKTPVNFETKKSDNQRKSKNQKGAAKVGKENDDRSLGAKGLPVITDDNSMQGKSKKKNKYVNLYSQEGQQKDVVLLKGRHLCTCEASLHNLINNCLKCGRIVCEQEGAGPCLFCETEIAIQKRDRLLEYDRTSERLTKVIDDESDYYNPTSVWLSEEEKTRLKQREAELHEQLHASRRCVIEEETDLPIDPFKDPVLMKINQSMTSKSLFVGEDSISAIPEFTNLKYVGQGSSTDQFDREPLLKSRIQDRELQEMSDRGMCLSMHQPWASLLVAGLKRHEGRSWYTTHRGTLWIAAAAKQPTAAEIQAEENHVRELLGKPRELVFPSDYPIGCMLGCVNMVDCLSQEEYRVQYPNGPSLEPFVFICEHPRRLPIFFPMKGKHKIFKLEHKLHQAAQKSLKRVDKLQAEMAAESS
ncbi:hypothetical protein B566_EDAN015847 [Ephemera danica]|nr:hypothetical protein B566_EDAN015847 [Ephemera danica]